jgi:hypothetical protein
LAAINQPAPDQTGLRDQRDLLKKKILVKKEKRREEIRMERGIREEARVLSA